ncbi:hypothetical protein FRB90_001067 [Tulasnella sp. 427]|nr:hypothetical protein FRB90_001067 [Tulasnella sp. 427]
MNTVTDSVIVTLSLLPDPFGTAQTFAGMQTTKVPVVSRPFDKIPDEILEEMLLFYQTFIIHQNTFGIARGVPVLNAMLVSIRWRDVAYADPRLWTDVFLQHPVDPTVLKLRLKLAGQSLSLRLWVTSDALKDTAALEVLRPCAYRFNGMFLQPLSSLAASEISSTNSPTFASQVGIRDIEKWIALPLPNLRYLHLGGLTVDGNPPTIEQSLPKLKKLSFGMTVPRFVFPNAQLQYLGFALSLLTLQKLSEYLLHCGETLETLCLDGVTIADMGSTGEGFPALVLPHLTEMIMLTPGGNGLAKLLLTKIHCPSLHSLTFSASPGKRFGAWHRQSNSQELRIPSIDLLNFNGGTMPIGAFRDILDCTAGIRKLNLPRFGTAAQRNTAVDALISWGTRKGTDPGNVEEVVVTGLGVQDMVKIVVSLPSIKTLDVSRSTLEGKDGIYSSEWRWLVENVENLIGVEE